MSSTVLQFSLAAALVGAQATPPAPAPPPRPDCSAAEHRQLDFWIGDWNVYDPAHYGATAIATSRIEAIANGCAIREDFRSPSAPGGPYQGTSYSSFDRKDGSWHQMYVDTNGNVSWYSGGLTDGAMMLTAPGRQNSLQRMVYRPRPDNSVEQIGTVSTDGGRTWQPGYDLVYRRRPGVAAP